MLRWAYSLLAMDSPHFLPRRKHCRRQANKSKFRFRKTPCHLRCEKRVAGDDEGSIGGLDEIKRRDSRPAATA